MEIPGGYIIDNNHIRKAPDTYSYSIINDQYIYEVIRIIEGIPLFLEDHLVRLDVSLRLKGLDARVEIIPMAKLIMKLISLNQKDAGNLEIFLRPGHEVENETPLLCAHIVPHQYPSDDDYINGVSLGILKAERHKPEIKVMQSGLRLQANTMMEKQDTIEVLLESKDGGITEGSRSNIFFIKGDKVYTAPARQVLSGITRMKVIEICKTNSIPLAEENISRSDLNNFDAAFNTSTTRHVLPVRNIGDIYFDPSHHLTRQIIGIYRIMIDNYVLEKTGI